jgi:tRNA dimethylallyltransferase
MIVEAPSSPMIVLLGPTASGKTALSLHLAGRFSGEILSCDSVAVYREMEIGTAKPSLAERRQVSHHLIDVADPTEAFSAGDYSRLARVALADISARGRLPIVTGGTGLYLRALVDGLFSAPQRSEKMRERLRRAGETRSKDWLHRLLTRLDRQAAKLIHPNDTPKLIRAIEVCLTARQPMTQAWESGRDKLQGFQILRIGLNPDRKALYARINARAAAMFDQGLVEETSQLAAKYGEDARPLTSLGYKQALANLKGEMTPPEAIASAQQGHRNYAKRQMTWFRREPDVQWLNGFGNDDSIRSEAEQTITSWLAGATRER